MSLSTHQRIRRKMAHRREKALAKERAVAERAEILETMEVKELREYAAHNLIDLGKLKKKDEIKDCILAAHKEMDAIADAAAEEKEKKAAEREKQFGSMTVKELQAYADKYEIDVSGLKYRPDIRERIYGFLDETEYNNADPENNGSDNDPAKDGDDEKEDADPEGGDGKSEDGDKPAVNDGEGGDPNGDPNAAGD